MVGIFIAKIKGLYRNPWTLILMTVMSILFALIIGDNRFDKITVPVYMEEETMRESDVVQILQDQDVFEFEWVSKEDVAQKITNGKREFGLHLQADDFQVIVGIDSPHVHLLEQTVKNAYMKNAQIEQFATSISGGKNVVYEQLTEQSIFHIESASFQGNHTSIYDSSLHTLFGFTLFFVVYTIAYSVVQILIEKKSGVWDRMILSPVKKYEMYIANFLYSFLIGYLQVLIVFLIFRFIVQIDFHGTFLQALLVMVPYVFAIVALAIFITGAVQTMQQFNAVIPIVALSMAMIGGAFWPLEIVESKLMLLLAKFVPITYGMEVLHGVTLYGYSTEQLLLPISILLLMGVVLGGVGIHLMEKRYIV